MLKSSPMGSFKTNLFKFIFCPFKIMFRILCIWGELQKRPIAKAAWNIDYWVEKFKIWRLISPKKFWDPTLVLCWGTLKWKTLNITSKLKYFTHQFISYKAYKTQCNLFKRMEKFYWTSELLCSYSPSFLSHLSACSFQFYVFKDQERILFSKILRIHDEGWILFIWRKTKISHWL